MGFVVNDNHPTSDKNNIAGDNESNAKSSDIGDSNSCMSNPGS